MGLFTKAAILAFSILLSSLSVFAQGTEVPKLKGYCVVGESKLISGALQANALSLLKAACPTCEKVSANVRIKSTERVQYDAVLSTIIDPAQLAVEPLNTIATTPPPAGPIYQLKASGASIIAKQPDLANCVLKVQSVVTLRYKLNGKNLKSVNQLEVLMPGIFQSAKKSGLLGLIFGIF